MSNKQHNIKQAAAAEINRLSKAFGGKITPAQLVDAARQPSSPLHPYFEWNNDTAAEKYREIQARTLLRSCHVRYEVHNRKVSIPAYVRDPEAGEADQGYTPTATVKTDADLAREVLLKEFDRAASMLRRARNLGAYFEMEADIDSMVGSLCLMRNQIESTNAQLNA